MTLTGYPDGDTQAPLADQSSRLKQVERWIESAEVAQQQYEAHGLVYAREAFCESELEAQRPKVKDQAVKRLMGDGKMAATPAKELSVLDEEYQKHLETQRQCVYRKDVAHCHMETARIRAYMSLAAMRAIAGLI